jgi:hypothetical protein
MFRAKSLSLALQENSGVPMADAVSTFTAGDFGGFARAGYAKVAWNFRLRTESPECTVLSTERRIKCFGRATLWKFRVYWSLIGPFSGLMRKAILKQVKTEADAILKGAS